MTSPYGMELAESCATCNLRSAGCFCSLDQPALNAFEAVKYTTSYPQGAVLFVEGQTPRGIFVVCKGRVKLSITSSDGKVIILRFAGPGEVLGLHATLTGDPYESTAETLEPCQVNSVRRDDFLHLLRQHPQASIHAAQQLSASYHTACEQIRSLGLAQSAPQKLAGFLLDWAAKGKETKDGIRATCTLTHEEIGQIIGTSRETVTRALGGFKHRGLAALRGSTLLIQDRAALREFAGL